MEYTTVNEISKKWKMNERKITLLCREGKIKGAEKKGKSWMIPFDCVKPEGKHGIKTDELLPLPIGLSDFKKISSEYYYIDKTLMIKDIIDSKYAVSLYTRPRRFGKTINMNMLKLFFEKSDQDNSVYFKDKLIWKCGKKYQDYQGKFPVIFLSFKDVKCNTFEEAIETILSLIQDEYLRHKYVIQNNPNLNELEKQYISNLVSGTLSEMALSKSLFNLSKILYEFTKSPAIIIIDEYDTPIHSGHIKGYYEKIISFMRNLFSGAFKDNSNLAFGFMTGILRVTNESIFSGLNNLKEHSVLSEKFSDYFGFTKKEVKELLKYYGHLDKLKEVYNWYDGYKFGSNDIINPWSILNYIDEGFKPMAYWQSTGSNDIIKKIVSENSDSLKPLLLDLLDGKSVFSEISPGIIYPEIKNNPFSVFSFLLSAGYLKVDESEISSNNKMICKLKIPNREILCIYSDEILSALMDTSLQSSAIIIQNAVLNQNIDTLKHELTNFLKRSISMYDYGHESFYHGLMIGMYAVMNNYYSISSNQESGDGRYDIQLSPLDINKNKTGILIEIKVLRSSSENTSEQLLKLSTQAIKQINENHYTEKLKQAGIKHFLKYGIAFCKKEAEISFEEESSF